MNHLHERIIEVSKKHKLSHLGSCLTAVSIIDKIYKEKKPDEKFILSCGHAGLALYVVLEQYGYNAEELLEKCGIHPERMPGIDCSTGSLGQGLLIALGMAMADRSKNVYCLISDGEAFEGSVYEAINVIHKYNVDNLQIYLNYNGFSAYDEVPENFIYRLIDIAPFIQVIKTNVEDYGLRGLSAHYVTL